MFLEEHLRFAAPSHLYTLWEATAYLGEFTTHACHAYKGEVTLAATSPLVSVLFPAFRFFFLPNGLALSAFVFIFPALPFPIQMHRISLILYLPFWEPT